MDLDLSVVLAISVLLWLKYLKFVQNMFKQYHWTQGLKGYRPICSLAWRYSGSRPICSAGLICVIVAKMFEV